MIKRWYYITLAVEQSTTPLLYLYELWQTVIGIVAEIFPETLLSRRAESLKQVLAEDCKYRFDW